jgi:hypothetical protein
MEASGQLHSPATLSPRKEPRHQSDMSLVRPQSRSGIQGKINILDSTGTRTLASFSSKDFSSELPNGLR